MIDKRQNRLIKVNRMFMQLSVGNAIMRSVDKYREASGEGRALFLLP